ncbi:A/G-specific adenine glycosylase [Novosphingobium sp. 9]|uniref:A/G-specific adenine glycosylase n=1 Tax=Novosphingobium sp. 9 TaxID=2025349 RepID=UPI0021B68033|nr:A/G-specific adenine glycosylase [Novosphingobium sp. 9]
MDSSSETALLANDPPHVAVARDLLAWYDVHARQLPWRAPPGTPPSEPYRVWLSEVMLQQTTVAAVKAYFAAFIERWPSVMDLAAAPDADVMAAWAGLGYYARARNLLACAREVSARGGVFPSTEEELRALPGLGAYTAAAVAAIAFGQRAVVVDANVERVVARLFALEDALPGARPRIRELADRITPDARAGDFAQAMMDLGATVCTSRNPRCLLCPISADCAGRMSGEPERFPVKAPKKAKPRRQGRAFWIEREIGGEPHVLTVRREGKGMLGGMRALPDDGWSAKGDGHAEPPLAGAWEPLGRVEHVFTHFTLELGVSGWLGADAPLEQMARDIDGEWWPLARIDEAGLPTLFARAARLGLT